MSFLVDSLSGDRYFIDPEDGDFAPWFKTLLSRCFHCKSTFTPFVVDSNLQGDNRRCINNIFPHFYLLISIPTGEFLCFISVE